MDEGLAVVLNAREAGREREGARGCDSAGLVVDWWEGLEDARIALVVSGFLVRNEAARPNQGRGGAATGALTGVQETWEKEGQGVRVAMDPTA